MFGTLSTQSKEPLTFVENPDVATVLSRNRRDKPHVSCELCRTRKTRCSGESSGCDKCVAIAAECRYPSRDTRRKKRGHSSFHHGDATSSRTGSSKQETPGNHVENPVMEGEPNQRHDNDNVSSSGPALPTGSDMGVLAGDADQHVEQQHIEQWLSSNPIRNHDAVSDDHVVPEDCGIDEWPGLASLLGPELTIPLEVNPGELEERPGSAFFEHGLYPSDDDDDGSRPIPCSQIALPMESVMASLSTALASPRPSGSCSTRSIDSTKDHQSSQDMPRYASSRRGPPSLTQTSYTGSRRAATLEDRRKMQVGMASTPRRRGSGRDFSSSSLHMSPREACRCLNRAVHLLEELGARSTCKNPASMDILLSLLRHGLARSKEILTCQRCHGQGEEGVLVALACQYMATMYERVVHGCVAMLEDMMNQRHRPPQRSDDSSSPPSSAGWPGAAWPDENESAPASGETDDMWFSTYRIESSCERMHVLTTLVTVQITEFAQLLGTMRVRAAGRPRRMMILIETEKTTKMTRRLLRTTIDRAIATKENDVDM